MEIITTVGRNLLPLFIDDVASVSNLLYLFCKIYGIACFFPIPWTAPADDGLIMKSVHLFLGEGGGGIHEPFYFNPREIYLKDEKINISNHQQLGETKKIFDDDERTTRRI